MRSIHLRQFRSVEVHFFTAETQRKTQRVVGWQNLSFYRIDRMEQDESLKPPQAKLQLFYLLRSFWIILFYPVLHPVHLVKR